MLPPRRRRPKAENKQGNKVHCHTGVVINVETLHATSLRFKAHQGIKAMAFFKKQHHFLNTDFLVAGLGNPGPEYEGTRHNTGFMAATRLMRRHEMGRTRNRYGGRWCEGTVTGVNLAVILPMTYMNRSGEAVASAARHKHIDPVNITVIHDDMDFPFGSVRVKQGGGAGGHNGLASIVAELGTDAFNRVRIGIGRPDDPAEDARDWVLSPLGESDEKLMPVLDTAVDCIETIITEGIEAAMNRFNRRDQDGDPAGE